MRTFARLWVVLMCLSAVVMVQHPLAGQDRTGAPRPAATEKQRDVTVHSCLVTVLDEAQVAAPEPGLLVKIHVREGELIKTGAPLAQIDDRQAVMEQRQAEFELLVAKKETENDVNVRYAKAAYGLAEAEYESAKKAIEQSPGSISPSELKQRELAAQRAKLQIEQSERDLDVAGVATKTREVLVDLAKLKVEQRKIKAPIAGVVVDISKRVGEWVTPGEPVMRLVRVDRFRVEGLIDARQYGRELEHLAVTVEVENAGGKQATYTGAVVFVSPEIEPVTGKVRLWAEVENHDLHLRAGTRATMTIHLDRPVARAAVPEDAPAP